MLAARRFRSKRLATLILAEGSSTEPNYIDALARLRGLSALSIPRNHRTDPVGLVRVAADKLRSDRSLQRAFVVFDTYEHQGFEEALRLARELRAGGVQLDAIPSYPSFELWLLLHFEFTRAPLRPHEALDRLKRHVPHYDKGSAQVMDEIVLHLDRAVHHAERGRQQALESGDLNSCTTVHEMVIQLLS